MVSLCLLRLLSSLEKEAAHFSKVTVNLYYTIQCVLFIVSTMRTLNLTNFRRFMKIKCHHRSLHQISIALVDSSNDDVPFVGQFCASNLTNTL
jgi:hypothetical protein